MDPGKERLLSPSHLPHVLWDRTAGALRLPAQLTQAYETLIDRHALRKLADDRDPDNPPHGGLTPERTNLHFAQAFDGSAARAQLALLDPKCDASEASNTYLSAVAGNSLCLTDAPCGAGATAFSFLSNIAELRAHKVLPREPLDVFLIGAEISAPARAYAEELFHELRPTLEQQAIFVDAVFMDWDVTDRLSNTKLVRKMTEVALSHPNRLLLVANFNGFLERERRRADARPQLEELFRYASGDRSVAIWIEPAMNRATRGGGILPYIRALFQGDWAFFTRDRIPADAPIPVSSARFYMALRPTKTARVTLAVCPFDLRPMP